MPRDFIIEMEPFSHENGLLSSVHKRLRPALQRRYGERLEQLYADLERKQNEELMALRGLGSELSVLEKVGKALEASLGVPGHRRHPAVQLRRPRAATRSARPPSSALLEDIFGVAVPVNAILSPAGNPQQWARAIEAALADDGRRLADVRHGSTARAPARSAPPISTSPAFIDADTLAAGADGGASGRSRAGCC